MRVSILQSNYIPWFGYFDIIRLSDVTVIFDSAQFTKSDWRNRNVLSSPSGLLWLTIPVATSGRAKQSINEVAIADSRWHTKHWKTVRQVLSRSAHFHEFEREWEELYAAASHMRLLHDINLLFLQNLMARAHITTTLVDDRQLDLDADSPTDRLIGICRQLGADSYLTGPAGLDYIDVDRFDAAAVTLEVVDYPAATTTSDFKRVSILQNFAEFGSELSGIPFSEVRRVSR